MKRLTHRIYDRVVLTQDDMDFILDMDSEAYKVFCKVTDRLAEYEDRDEKGCVCCEYGVYHDVLGSPCNYNFCPICGKKLNTI